MPQANQVFERVISVLDAATLAGVTGLDASDFVFDLKKGSTDVAFAAAAETVTVAEIGSGLYWVRTTPVSANLVYRLSITPAAPDSHIVEPESGFQFEVDSFAPSGGPYLTTRVNVRRALELRGIDQESDPWGSDHEADDAIDDLLASVTDFVLRCFEIDLGVSVRTLVTEAPGMGNLALVLPHQNVTVTSVHDSTELPRVFDSTTLLVSGEDYLVDEEAGIIHRTDALAWTVSPKSIQVVYSEGSATVPASLERAAIEVIAAKLAKGRGQLYHVMSEKRGDGEIDGIRNDDIPRHAREVFELHRGKRGSVEL